jgi:FtsH-binding integral membrane protein
MNVMQPAPASASSVVDRSAFLKKVGAFTFLGLLVASITGVLSMFFVAPLVFEMGSYGVLGAMFGSFFLAHYGARAIVYRTEAKVAGFLFGSVCEGFSMGFLLLLTLLNFGGVEGVRLILECLTLTTASALGMLLYTMTAKHELSLVRAGLATFGVPLLFVMVFSVLFPIPGALGIVVGIAFVLFSGAALLYKLNRVVYAFPDGAHVEGAYELTMSLLVLFWNILSLLNRARR